MKKVDEAGLKTINKRALAAVIAFMPPLWAVLSPYIGVGTGAAALIVAGVYAANGNKRGDAVKILLGFLLGDVFSVIALWMIESLPFSADLNTYLTLFVLGAAAVMIGETTPRQIHTPSLLCGWAIGLTIMGPSGMAGMGTLPVQIGVSMAVGVLYVGVGTDMVCKWIVRALTKGAQTDPR